MPAGGGVESGVEFRKAELPIDLGAVERLAGLGEDNALDLAGRTFVLVVNDDTVTFQSVFELFPSPLARKRSRVQVPETARKSNAETTKNKGCLYGILCLFL